MNSASRARQKMNCSEDTDFEGDDADFVEDVDNVVVDDEGNAVEVDAMLIVQDPETNEISLFIPDNESDDVPESLNIIGEVISADTVDLDSSKKQRALRANRRSRRTNSNRSNVSLRLVGNYWEDRRGNKWSADLFTQQEATQHAASLENTTDCTNCVNCTDCVGCADCTDCVRCDYCTDCEHVSDLTNEQGIMG